MTSVTNVQTQSLSQVLADMKEMGSSKSLQFVFARLQLAQSKICSTTATQYMQQIQDIQDRQAEIADLISQARKLQDEADASGKETVMPESMIKAFEKYGLMRTTSSSENKHAELQTAYENAVKNVEAKQAKVDRAQDRVDNSKWYNRGFRKVTLGIAKLSLKSATEKASSALNALNNHKIEIAYSKDDWTENIKSLTNYQESIGNKTQTLMVYLQDAMSQYNSFLQGASSAINEASQVLTAIAKGQ